VVLCEKGRVACEQSSRNWGWIRQLGRDNDELPIMMESTRLWENLSREIGEDVGFRQHGIIYLASSEKKLAARESWMATAAAHNLDTQMITAASVEQQISGIPGRWCVPNRLLRCLPSHVLLNAEACQFVSTVL
jgi:glycine/D-amino acid oxidase-like deaminating enzyme